MDASCLQRFKPAASGSTSAEAPLLVSDPLKARWLMGLDKQAAAARRRASATSWAFCRGAISGMPMKELPAQTLRELERLFSGGNVLWRDGFENLVVNEGLNDLLLNWTLGILPANDTDWFIGIIGRPVGLMTSPRPMPPADTLASHAGWAELVNPSPFQLAVPQIAGLMAA